MKKKRKGWDKMNWKGFLIGRHVFYAENNKQEIIKNVGEFSCLLTTTIKITCSERFLPITFLWSVPAAGLHHSWLDTFLKILLFRFVFWIRNWLGSLFSIPYGWWPTSSFFSQQKKTTHFSIYKYEILNPPAGVWNSIEEEKEFRSKGVGLIFFYFPLRDPLVSFRIYKTQNF